MDEKSVSAVILQEPLFWKVYVDGIVNQRGPRVGLVLVSPEKITIKIEILGHKQWGWVWSSTNGNDHGSKNGKKAVEMFSDSRLVVGQVKGELEARDERMQGYSSQVRHLQSGFESFNLLHILRSGNTHANSLATLATSSSQSLPRVILVEDVCKSTGVRKEVVHVHQVRVGPN